MASPTLKVKKIRNRKETSAGQRRKRETRHELRVKIRKIGEALGLPVPEVLNVK